MPQRMIEGGLEIDDVRNVLYFHTPMRTILRIQGIPTTVNMKLKKGQHIRFIDINVEAKSVSCELGLGDTQEPETGKFLIALWPMSGLDAEEAAKAVNALHAKEIVAIAVNLTKEKRGWVVKVAPHGAVTQLLIEETLLAIGWKNLMAQD